MAAFVAGTIKAIIPLDAAGSLLARRDIEEDDWWLLDELYRSHAGTGKQTPQTLLDQIDYQRKLSVQLPLRPETQRKLVLYPKSGDVMRAARRRAGHAVIDHGLYWYRARNSGEAAYLTILLNAGCLQQTYADARESGRDFHLQPWRKVPIPRYDKSVALHGKIAALCTRAEKIATKTVNEELKAIPLCTGRGTSAYAVNEESPSPIGPGALQAPGHPRAAAAALLRCWWRGPGPAVLIIGTAAVTTVLPEIPPETLAEWQRAVDLTARLARVPASLIMRTERPKHTVLVSSRTEGNPYDVGREYDLNALLYCQGVFDNDGELVVEDATHDPVWAGNEDLADGMRFYIGYPLKWPSGEVFGTICVLDRERNDHALLFREGLQAFAGVVEATLRSLVEIAERRRLETALQQSLDQTARHVVERTSELQDANTALRVLSKN